MSKKVTHKPTLQDLRKKWGSTPCTHPDVLEGMEEYKKVLNGK